MKNADGRRQMSVRAGHVRDSGGGNCEFTTVSTWQKRPFASQSVRPVATDVAWPSASCVAHCACSDRGASDGRRPPGRERGFGYRERRRKKVGWVTGFEPATSGATVDRSSFGVLGWCRIRWDFVAAAKTAVGFGRVLLGVFVRRVSSFFQEPSPSYSLRSHRTSTAPVVTDRLAHDRAFGQHH